MGKRRKKPLTVYLEPDDPLLTYLLGAPDRNEEAVALMRIGLQTKVIGGRFEQVARVTVTPKVTVTKRQTPKVDKPVEPARVTVTRPVEDDGPGWDDDP